MSAIFPQTFLPPAAITALWQRLYSCVLSLETEFPEFISNLSHHRISLSTGTWSKAECIGHPTWNLPDFTNNPPCPSPLHFTVLDSRCYLNQLHPPVSIHVPYCLLNSSFIISKQICAGWKQMLWYDLTWNNFYKLILLLLLFYYRDLWFVVRKVALKFTITVLNL